MGIGYKTSWIAVRNREPSEVADALRLTSREPAPWPEGTERAYYEGTYVASPVSGWTLAHRIYEPSAGLPAWLATVSAELGEIQLFGTHRVSDYYVCGRAVDGQMTRAVRWGDGQVDICEGAPTQAEIGLGIGISSASDANDGEAFRYMPDEQQIMRLAGLWSVDPTSIDDDDVAAIGIHGMPPQTPESTALQMILSQIRNLGR